MSGRESATTDSVAATRVFSRSQPSARSTATIWFAFFLGGEHGLGHAEQGARRRIERLGSVDEILFVRSIGAPEDGAQHLAEHGERSVGEHGLHLAREHRQSRQTARRVETRKMLCAHDRGFSSDRCVACPMNAPFAIGSDAELAHGFEPFDDSEKILLARRFRPFSQPGERRALSVFGDDDQGLQSRYRLRRQAFDEAPVGAFAGEGAPREGDLLQGDGGRKQNAPLAQVFDHRRHDDVAAIGPRRLFDRDKSKGALVVAAKGANVEIGLKLAEVLATRFAPLGVNAEICRLACNLLGYEGEHVGRRRFVDAQRSSGEPKTGEVHGESEPVGRSPPPANQRHVLRREGMIPHDRRRVRRWIEQRRARLRR